MVRLGYPLLAIVLLLGLTGAGLAYWVGQRLAAPISSRARTLAAVAANPIGTVVDPERVRLAAGEAGELPPNGKSLDQVGIAPEQSVAPASRQPSPVADEARLADLIPKGRRAVVVAFVDAAGRDRPVEAGDTVDVVATFAKGTDGLAEDTTTLVARDALVLGISFRAVNGPGDTLAPGDTLSIDQSAPTEGEATLAVTPREAQFLALAQRSGVVRLVRR